MSFLYVIIVIAFLLMTMVESDNKEENEELAKIAEK
jgi:hypothetical protein